MPELLPVGILEEILVHEEEQDSMLAPLLSKVPRSTRNAMMGIDSY